jgi:hypothetical protein
MRIVSVRFPFSFRAISKSIGFCSFCVRPHNGVGAQSPSCLLPIFDPDGVRQYPGVKNQYFSKKNL